MSETLTEGNIRGDKKQTDVKPVAPPPSPMPQNCDDVLSESDVEAKADIDVYKMRAMFWEDKAKRSTQEANYYRPELVKAHTLIGRIVHQASEHWDSINITEFFPTDNQRGKRTINNPSGNVE